MLLAQLFIPAATADDVQYLLHGDGGRLDWNDQSQQLVLDRPSASGYARLWTMDGDGQSLQCISCSNRRLPLKHHGNPAWHPGGKYIVFQAVDAELGGPLAKSSMHRLFTSPGSGVQNNIWIMTADGVRVWQITRLGKNEGVLHPHFSPDGTKLVWAQRISNEGGIGRWSIKLANFSVSGSEIAVSGIADLTPGQFLFYETHGFSPDGKSIIFTGMPPKGTCADFDIYTYNLETDSLKCLTNPSQRQWDEHAHFTPDGRHIVWMSSMGSGQSPAKMNQFQVKTDYWIMNADGTNKKQISFFNSPKAFSKQKRVICSDLAISGDGKYLFGYVQDPGTMTRPGSVVRLTIPD